MFKRVVSVERRVKTAPSRNGGYELRLMYLHTLECGHKALRSEQRDRIKCVGCGPGLAARDQK